MMRFRHGLAIMATVLVALLFVTRHHIRDLLQVARTYATYHQYMGTHPEAIYRYPPVRDDTAKDQVPRIIHQIFLQEGRNSTAAKYGDAIASCRTLHAEWDHKLWTDDSATAFMREHYPGIAPHYEGYQQSIQRANVLRYALLDHFGGIYLDLDVTCLAPLDNLLHLPWLTPGAYPAGVNNAFILSRPHHHFLRDMLAAVASHDLAWPLPYVENMLSTGCMFFTNRWMDYARNLPSPAADEDRVYILADENGNLEPHMLRGVVTTPLFMHGGASSWHGWDAAAIVLIGKHYGYFLLLLGLSFAATLALVWMVLGRTRGHSRRRSWSPIRRSMEKNADEERLLAGKNG